MHAAGGLKVFRLEDDLTKIFDFLVRTEVVRRGVHGRQHGARFSRRGHIFQQNSICVLIQLGFSMPQGKLMPDQIPAQRTRRGKKDGRHDGDNNALDESAHG